MGEDFPWKRIDILTPGPEHKEPVMAVQYRPIWTRFKAGCTARLEAQKDRLSAQAPDLGELNLVQHVIWMQEL